MADTRLRLVDAADALTVEQAAEILGIGRTAAYEAVRRTEIRAVRIGRRVIVPKRELERLLGVAAEGSAER